MIQNRESTDLDLPIGCGRLDALVQADLRRAVVRLQGRTHWVIRALWLTAVAVSLLLAGGIFLAEFGWLDPLRPAALQRAAPSIDTSELEDHLSRTHAARTGRHDDLEQAAQGVASSSLSGGDLQASLDQLFRTIDKEKAMTDQEHQHTKEILARLGSNQ